MFILAKCVVVCSSNNIFLQLESMVLGGIVDRNPLHVCKECTSSNKKFQSIDLLQDHDGVKRLGQLVAFLHFSLLYYISPYGSLLANMLLSKVFVDNNFIDIYCKCGCLEDVGRTFHNNMVSQTTTSSMGMSLFGGLLYNTN